MHSFTELSQQFIPEFDAKHFPSQPDTLYNACDYFLSLGGKRLRPVMCLMGNELFNDLHPDAYTVATAIELFHNFTLVHDDIMDAAPLRRGMQTVHEKYGANTALLAGDVMLVTAYEYLNKINTSYINRVIALFNKTAKEVCEGQQLDIDFEKKDNVNLDEYIKMIELKTSVLIAASLEMGAILGGAEESNRHHLYAFGKNLGIAFQIQDDYLDAFGNPEKVGKDIGGDIKQNKKTFLLIHALEVAGETEKRKLLNILKNKNENKVEQVLEIFKNCNADSWAKELKQKYVTKSLEHLEKVAVLSARKKPIIELVEFFIHREN